MILESTKKCWYKKNWFLHPSEMVPSCEMYTRKQPKLDIRP